MGTSVGTVDVGTSEGYRVGLALVGDDDVGHGVGDTEEGLSVGYTLGLKELGTALGDDVGHTLGENV